VEAPASKRNAKAHFAQGGTKAPGYFQERKVSLEMVFTFRCRHFFPLLGHRNMDIISLRLSVNPSVNIPISDIGASPNLTWAH
jgi:hypothetical protein